jgi:hypothetical protein
VIAHLTEVSTVIVAFTPVRRMVTKKPIGADSGAPSGAGTEVTSSDYCPLPNSPERQKPRNAWFLG